jgi:hypothetical protein
MSGVSRLAPFLGAAALEVIYWYQLRTELHLKKYQRLLRSKAYWIITVAMVLVGGLFTLIYFGDRLRPGELLVAGAAFPTLIKQLIAAFSAKQLTLGEDSTESEADALRTYFRPGSAQPGG